MSFGGGSSGQIRYTISVDDAQAIQKLQGVAQQFQALGATTQQTTQQMEQMPTVYDDIATSSDKVAQSQQQMTDGIKAQGDEVKKTTTAQQGWGTVLKNNVFAITSAVGGIISLVQQYTSLQRQQLMIQKLTNTEIGQRNKIAELTRKHAETLREFGQDSQEVLDIETDLDLLQKKHEVTVQTLTVRQEQLNLRMADFGLNILPNLMSAGGGIAQVIIGLKGLKTGQEAAGVAATAMGFRMKAALIGTGIGAILVAIGTFLVVFTRNLWGVQDAVFALGKRIGDVVPQLKGFLEMLKGAGIWLIKILGGEMPAGAEKATTAIEDVGDATTELATKTDETKKAVADMWKTLGEAPNITSALKIDVDKDKLTKKFLDYLPDSLTKDIKVFIKGRESVETIRDSFSETFALAMEMGGKDDKWANNFVNQTVKVLKEKFPNAPGSKELQAALAGTVAGPDTMTQVQTLIQKWKLNPSLAIDVSNVSTTGTPKDPLAAAILGKTGTGTTNAFFGSIKLDNKQASTHVEGLLDNIKKAVESFDWKGVQKTIVDGLFSLPANLAYVARTFIDPFLGSMLNVMLIQGPKMISSWVSDTFTWNNFQTALNQVTDIFINFSAWFWNGIKDPKQLERDVLSYLNGIANAIVVAFPQTSKTILEVGQLMGVAILDGLKTLKAFGTVAISWIGEKLSGAAANLLATGEEIGRQIWNGMVSIFNGKTILDLFTKKKTNDPNLNPFPFPQSYNDGTLRIDPITHRPIMGGYQSASLSPQTGGALGGVGGLISESLMKMMQQQLHIDFAKEGGGINNPFSYYTDQLFKKASAATTSTSAKTTLGGQYSAAGRLQLQQMGRDALLGGITTGAAANPKDIEARQVAQLTTNYNMLARAIVTVTKDNNQLAKTTAQLGSNNNTLARTIVTVTKDYNQEARAIVTTTSDNNQLARTISEIVKDNNQLAKTIVTVTKDYNQQARAIVTVTKDNNQLARTISQVTKNLNTVARAIVQTTKDAKALASALNKIPTNINIHVGASGPGLAFAQKGMHQTLGRDTLIMAHKGERVDIGPETGGRTGIGGGGGGGGQIVVNLTNVNFDRETTRTFRREMGKELYRFGPT